MRSPGARPIWTSWARYKMAVTQADVLTFGSAASDVLPDHIGRPLAFHVAQLAADQVRILEVADVTAHEALLPASQADH